MHNFVLRLSNIVCSMRHPGVIAAFVLIGVMNGCTDNASKEEPVSIQRNGESILFEGRIFPERFNQRRDRANGHHFIVWKGGGNAGKALIEAEPSDREILDALIAAGAEPGDNLTVDAWDERMNEESEAPDRRVAGTPVEISIRWDGQAHAIEESFADEPSSSFDIRVGGHAALIPVWRSGCVTCLFSCPGGRTSNHAFTIRDQAFDRHSFHARNSGLPPDGTQVEVSMTLKPAQASSSSG